MPRDTSFHDYVVYDLIQDIPGITSRSMFGGWGIYKDGMIFAIIAEGELYFKVDATNQSHFEEHGSHPFRYSQKGHTTATMSYWLVPEEIMENADKLAEWIEDAVTVSKNAKKK